MLQDWVAVAVVGVVLIWFLGEWSLKQSLLHRLKRLEPRSEDLPRAIDHLFAEYCLGRLDGAQLAALRRSASSISLEALNRVVCLEVAAGRYEEALSWRSLCPALPSKSLEMILRVNEGEAMANLGRTEESLAWLVSEPDPELTKRITTEAMLEHATNGVARLDGEPTMDRVALAGASCHRAWCLATLGRIQAAEAALREATPEDLPLLFRSEYFLSAAAIERAAGRWDDAARALHEAETRAARSSTIRNVHFGRGLLLAAQSKHVESLEHFEKGAQCEYVGQDGDALLAWGDALATLGRHDEAKKAWTLCSERDPQSPSAASARARLS